MSGWPRCSFVAEKAGDPLEGSAPPADRWFLVEHPGPWGRVAFAQSGIAPSTVAALASWAASRNGRVLLIRRPGRDARSGPRRWFRVDSRPGHEGIDTGSFVDDAELDPDAAGQRVDPPLFLVCAHGRHDTCCAVRGRPLAAALAAAAPDDVWECSHIGGCRFAPALVLLPHGFALGGVPVEEAAGIVRAYRAGDLDPRWVRGRGTHSPAVQAAQQHARAATGAHGVDDLQLVAAEADGPGWRVRFRDPDVTVLLAERRVETGRPLTCAARAPGWMRVFDLVAVTAAP